MEAIAALSLACNIVQVVEYGVKAVEIIAQVYRDGRSVDNAAIQNTAKQLQDLCQAIDVQANSTALEGRLKKIIDESTTVANELVRELSKFEGNRSKWTKLKAGLASVRKKGKIEKLQQQLRDCERAINTGILATLREQNQASKAMQERSFNDLSSTLQDFIVRLSQSQAQTTDLIRAENQATRTLLSHTRDALGSKIDSAEASRRRKQMLDSLRYPEMNMRRNQIEDASPGTFDAFFEPSSDHPLSDWFNRGSGILWIQGKAGSGKSTLMRFITQSAILANRTGANQPDPVMLSHFFWLSGTPSQRNLHGLLCSLAHQLNGSIDPVQFEDKLHTNDWSTRELEGLLLSSLESLATKTLVFILLDALDEYDEKCGRRNLLELINKLSNHAKLCVSSRPELFWVKHLQHDFYIKLEDTTQAAIETFIRQEFEGSGFSGYQWLTWSLASRADGIFLWAHIAVRDVLRGLDSNAGEEELRRRIQRLPRGMENLYKEMLGRHEEDWPLVQQEAALFFSTALLLVNGLNFQHFRGEFDFEYFPGYLYQYHAAMNTLSARQHDPDKVETLEQDCVRLSDRIASTCAGMLEVDTSQYKHSQRPMTLAGVSFTHRTARDFLLDVPFGRRLVQLESWDPASVVCKMIHAECLLYHFSLRKMEWDSIWRMLRAIRPKQQELNLDDADYLKMVLGVRKLLTALAHPESPPSPLPIEVRHKEKIFPWKETDHYDSIDFLGLTLEAGITCYFNCLAPMLQYLTVYYMEYLLGCAAASSDRPPIYLDVLRVLRQYGVQGTRVIWLHRGLDDENEILCGYTANELFLGNIFEAIREYHVDYVADALQRLDRNGLNGNDTYSFWLDTSGMRFDHYHILSDNNIGGDQSDTESQVASTNAFEDPVLLVEGNLEYWLFFIHSYMESRWDDQHSTHTTEDYRSTTLFRRLRFLMTDVATLGVPILMDDRLVTSTEDGETLLQLWEAAALRPLSLGDDSPSDQDPLKHEVKRLIRAVAAEIQADAQIPSDFHKSGLVRSDDYLKHENLLREGTAADEEIPVFKEERFAAMFNK